MTGDVPPGMVLTPRRWHRELEALRAGYPTAYQHSVSVGAVIFEVTVDVDGIDHHLRMTLPPSYPGAPPVIREVQAPGGSVIRPPGTRRFSDGSFCLFPHGSDPQGWHHERLAAEALDKAKERLALEHGEQAAGGVLRRDDRTLILSRTMVEVMGRPGAFGSLWVASLDAEWRESLAVHFQAQNPEISFAAAIEPQWAKHLSLRKEIPWAWIPPAGPPWEALLQNRVDLDEWLHKNLPGGVFARLREAEELILVRSSATAVDVEFVAIRRPLDDLQALHVATVVAGAPSDVLFSRVDGVVPQRERLSEAAVAIIGLGSLGATVAVALARAGVGRFLLIDHDRLSLTNVTRHVGNLRSLGGLKVEIVREEILAINPVAHVEIISKPLAWDIPTYGAALELEHWLTLHPRALVIATFVFAPIEQQLNAMLVRLGIPAIYASALGAADHGRIFRVIPGQTPCFECVLEAQDANPETFPRFAIDGHDERDQLPYHQPSLPGLAIDIWQISLITARFTLQTFARTLGVDVGYADEDGHHLLWTNRGGWGFDRPLQLRIERIPRASTCSVCSPGARGGEE